MTDRGRRLACVLVLALAVVFSRPGTVAAAGEFRTVDLESLRVTVDSEWPGVVAPGYVPIRLDLTNSGEPRTVDVVITGSRFFGIGRGARNGSLQIERRVDLARGVRVRFTMPVPVIGGNESFQITLREDGETLHRFGYTNLQVPGRAGATGALIVASGPLAARAAEWRRTITGRTGGAVISSLTLGAAAAPGLPVLDQVLDPQRLPTNWIGYTSLRTVIFGPDEWKGLPAEQRAAVLAWTAAGGNLLLLDTDSSPLFPAPGPAVDPTTPSARAYLLGRIREVSSGVIAARGLGPVLAESEKLQDPDLSLPVSLRTDWNAIAERGFRLPIPGIDGVRPRAYLFILILFAVLIGPVNYWILARRRQQVLFVLTAPLLSVLFIFVLAGYVLASEGNAVYGRAASITMLDQGRRLAVTRSSISLYSAGLTAAGDLRYSPETAVVHIGTDGHGRLDRVALDLAEGQRYSSSVIQARAPSNVEQIVVRTARERLTFTREAAGIGVVNALDAPVTQLLYKEGGQVYSLPDALDAGGRAVLVRVPVDPARFVPTGVLLAERLRHLVQYQPDGSYLAVLERSPFWEPGVPSLLERGSFHLVVGWPGGQP
jgi:hypothetical protein